MKDWNDVQARVDATWDFCERLRRNSTEKQNCIDSPKHAREYFAEKWFYLKEDPKADPNLTAIPEDVEFRVYDFTPIPKRDKLITIVLPPADMPLPLPSRPTDPVEDVWRCTWAPYLGFTKPSELYDTLRAK